MIGQVRGKQGWTLLILILLLPCVALTQPKLAILKQKQAKALISDSLYVEGVTAMRQAEFARAATLFSEVIEKDSLYVRAYLMRGYAKQFLGDTIGAFADYNKALVINPRNFEAYIFRGQLARAARNFSRANADFTAAISLSPDSVQAYFYRAMARIGLGALEEAIEDLTTVINSKTPFDEAFSQRAACYASLGQTELALKDYAELIRRREDAEAYRLRAAFYRRQKQYGLALADFERAVELRPDHPELLFESGTLKLGMGMKEKGLADVLKAQNLGYKPAAELLSKYYSKDRTLDSLRVYYAPQIVVEALTPEQAAAVKEIKLMSQAGTSVAKANVASMRSGRAQDLFNHPVFKAARVGGMNLFGCNENALLSAISTDNSQTLGVLEGSRLREVPIQCVVILLQRRAQILQDAFVVRLVQEMAFLVDRINNQMQMAETSQTIDDARREAENAIREIEEKIQQLREYMQAKNYPLTN
ncbi:MAG: tetratricopeptide repeat protein [Chloroherpetonaceae bacterium]|nr:tetratricopeptide repeat protein [Chloroherpetonaceae bacterium]